MNSLYDIASPLSPFWNLIVAGYGIMMGALVAMIPLAVREVKERMNRRG